MAGVKISQLQDGGALQPTDAFPVARGSFTRKILGAELLTLANFNVVDSPTIDLDWNSTTRTLSADVSTAVKEASAFNVVDSPTIDLSWNASTRTLSAEVIPLTLPTTKVYQMWSVIGTGSSYLPWGAAFEASNPAYPGGRNAVYNSSLATKLSSETFDVKRNSFISITDIAYWNWDGPVHSSATDPIYIWQTYDYSIDGGTTWVQDMSANTGSVKVLLGTSYYGAPVQNGGGSGVGTIYLSAAANTSIKFRPKYRFQKSSAMTGLNLTNMTGYGSHTITIDPII